jgi:hypothetical protein
MRRGLVGSRSKRVDHVLRRRPTSGFPRPRSTSGSPSRAACRETSAQESCEVLLREAVYP